MRPSRRNNVVSSFGVICHRIKIDFESRIVYPEFLLVQRRDSIAFVEFVRGKYGLDDHAYIGSLVDSMTQDEQQKVATLSFDALWRNVWGCRRPSARSNTEYTSSSKTHSDLCAQHGGTLANLISQATTCAPEREWGFPKGRKSGAESDLACARREFEEETGLNSSCVHMYDMPPYEEMFEGGNGVLYRHVYFLMRMVDMRGGPVHHPRSGSVQAQEVRAVEWFDYANMCKKLHNHPTRIAITTRANHDVMLALAPHTGDAQLMSRRECCEEDQHQIVENTQT